MNTVSLFTFREPLPNKTQQQNQKKGKQTIHVDKYIESNSPPGKISCIKPCTHNPLTQQYKTLVCVLITCDVCIRTHTGEQGEETILRMKKDYATLQEKNEDFERQISHHKNEIDTLESKLHTLSHFNFHETFHLKTVLLN